MKQLLAHLPNRQQVFFRGDSGFFNGKLFDLLEQLGHRYLVKVKLKGLKQLLIGQLWQPIKGKPGWEYCEFWHQCGSWTRKNRKRTEKGDRFIFSLSSDDQGLLTQGVVRFFLKPPLQTFRWQSTGLAEWPHV